MAAARWIRERPLAISVSAYVPVAAAINFCALRLPHANKTQRAKIKFERPAEPAAARWLLLVGVLTKATSIRQFLNRLPILSPFLRMKQLVQRFAPQHLSLKDAAEVAGCGVESGLHRRRAAGVGFEFEAGDLAVGDAAGNDPLEVAQVSGDVEGEAV